VRAEATRTTSELRFGRISDLLQDFDQPRLIPRRQVIHGGKSTKEVRSRAGSSGVGPPEAAFPFKMAFAVQFVERAGATRTKFEGRIEHLESGRRARFGSRKALLDLLAEMLVEESPRPGEQGETAEGAPRSRRRGAETRGA
jgi:hypothetical protein